jgi:hypothetical protein
MLIGAATAYIIAALLTPAIASSAEERVYHDFAPALWAVVGMVLALFVHDLSKRH